MSGLDLTPNEFVGYRIKPDWYSFNVVIVKKHGKGSKNAGDEYEKPLAYCKSLASAVDYIFSHSVRVRGERAQEEQFVADKSVASVQALASQFTAALADARQASAELTDRIAGLELSQKELVKALGSSDSTDTATVDEATA